MTKLALGFGAWFALALFYGCGGQSTVQGGPADGDLKADDGSPGRGGSRPSGGSGGTTPVVPTGGVGGTAVSPPTGGFVGTGGVSVGGTGVAGSAAAGGAIDPPGPVLCGGIECAAPRACCNTTGVCFDPVSEPQLCPRPDTRPPIDRDELVPCASNAHCGPGEYCSLDPGTTCRSTGFCYPRTSCPSSSYAVCACDGNSYANITDACRAGTSAGVFHGGFCGDTVDANEGEFSPRWVTLCGTDAHCPSGQRCCSITNICYPESDPGRCQVPPEGTRYPCTADDQCMPDYEYCAGDGCSGPGGCTNADPDDECGVRLAPVCGCNGVSYTSPACASAERVRVAHSGACE